MPALSQRGTDEKKMNWKVKRRREEEEEEGMERHLARDERRLLTAADAH